MVQNMSEMRSQVEDFSKNMNDLKAEIMKTNTTIEKIIDDKLTDKLT